jgi:hypothetical protein
MTAIADKDAMLDFWNTRCIELLHMRNNLSRDDLEYVVSKAEGMRDVRLQSCIVGLLGWGDEERAELETFCAVALECMAMMRPSQIREATKRVEIRGYMTAATKDQ